MKIALSCPTRIVILSAAKDLLLHFHGCVVGIAALLALAGCHSPHIDVAVNNQTGAPIRLLEVDYPSASFGVDRLASGATFHYRIQVQGSGPVKVQYTANDAHQPHMQGPALAENQEGTLEIVLLPNGKADFNPHLSTRH